MRFTPRPTYANGRRSPRPLPCSRDLGAQDRTDRRWVRCVIAACSTTRIYVPVSNAVMACSNTAMGRPTGAPLSNAGTSVSDDTVPANASTERRTAPPIISRKGPLPCWATIPRIKIGRPKNAGISGVQFEKSNPSSPKVPMPSMMSAAPSPIVRSATLLFHVVRQIRTTLAHTSLPMTLSQGAGATYISLTLHSVTD